ncbi:MAG: hypothetical protein ACRYGK_04980 [Janthinobacterium lividum]
MAILQQDLAALPQDTASGVSWGAIFAGATAAASLSLILLILGVGLGFSAMSPWASSGAEAGTIGIASVIWLAFTQIASSGLGGYMAGRLRTKWAGTHTDEVYFRDTAHGLVSWSVATLVTAALLGSVVGNVVSKGASAAGSVASSVASAAGTTAAAGASAAGANAADNGNSPLSYLTDTIMRTDPSAATPAGTPDNSVSEAGRIMANAVRTNALAPEDRQYLAKIVARHTGISEADADKRITDGFNKFQAQKAEAEKTVKETAEKARKAAAYAALWMFVSLLASAFVASLCATMGGRRRDNVAPYVTRTV